MILHRVRSDFLTAARVISKVSRILSSGILACLATPVFADVISTEESIAVSGELDEGDGGFDGSGSRDFSFFEDSTLVTNLGLSAGGSVSVTDLSGGGQVIYTGSVQLSSSDAGTPGDAVSVFDFTVGFEVRDEPAPFQLLVDADQSFSGSSARSEIRIQLNNSDGNSFSTDASCSSFDGCSDLALDESRLLPPGAYVLKITSRADANGSGAESSISASWSLSVGSACLLTWADPAGGDFSDPENWSPAEVPEASEDGCVNLLLDEAGSYAITLPEDAAANSLTVSAGEPSLLGGTLTLGGVEFPDSLSILNEARLTVENGLVQTASALISNNGGENTAAQPAFLRIKPGAELKVFDTLEVGRGIGEAGELVLGDGVEQTLFSVLGNATLGGAGKSTVFGNGNLNFGVFGDLSMGLFDGSQSNLNLNGDAAQVRAVEYFVFGALTIGAQGSAALSLGGLSVGTVDSLRMGLLAGGEGTLNLSGADCQLGITKDAEIGVAGQADILIAEGARLNGSSMLLGTEAGGSGTLEVSGDGSKLELSGEATIGGAGSASVEVSNGGTLKAGFVTVDSTDQDGALLSVNGATEPAKVEAGNGVIIAGTGNGGLALSGQANVTTPSLAISVLAGSDSLSIWQGDESESIDEHTLSVEVTDNAQIGLDGKALVSSFGTSNHKFGELWLGVNANGVGDFATFGAFAVTTVTGDLLVGVEGQGSLEINEGRFSAGACTLGAQIGGLGEVRISGGASFLIGAQPAPGKGSEAPGFLQVGPKSNGLLELFDASTRVECGEAIIGGDNPAAGGTVNIDTGAAFESFGSVTLGAADGPALVRVADRATMTIGSLLIIGPKGLFIAGGGANVSASFVSIEGRLRIVDGLSIERPQEETSIKGGKGSEGPTVIDGDLEVGADGVLEVVAGAGDALVVTGAATLDGTLVIDLKSGVTFTDGQLLNLIDFQGGVTGSFTEVTFLNAPEGFDADIEFDGGTLQLRVINGGTATGEGEGEADTLHSADTDGDERISLSELLRGIQFYNAFGLHCRTTEGESEDGYIPGVDESAESCSPHDSDFNPQDWVISLNELLRLIQFYNAGGYIACNEGESEDLFCISG